MNGLLLLVVLTYSVYKPNLLYLWWENGNLWIHFTKQFLSLCGMPLWWIHSCFEENEEIESPRLWSAFRLSVFCCDMYAFTHHVVRFLKSFSKCLQYFFWIVIILIIVQISLPLLRNSSSLSPHPCLLEKSVIWVISIKKPLLKPRSDCSPANEAKHKRRWGQEQ